MYSIYARISSISALFTSTIGALMFACFLSTAFVEKQIPVDISVSYVDVQVAEDYTASKRVQNDLGRVRLSLKANVESLFNWNVKELFLFLSAQYSTSNNPSNEVVLWDKIILRGENYNINHEIVHTKYPFWDDGKGLRGNDNVTLKFYWNIIPNSGIMPIRSSASQHSFSFPQNYLEKHNSS